jgi:NAD(P)-dependent dehydrogenase (short-subunit alcohol dehydrogenase family)
MTALAGKVTVVAGATRGAGRGIACMLGEAGATVYCTGRSVRGKPATTGRPETIEETAEMVAAHGGIGIAVQVDHSDEAQVAALFERIEAEQGHLDVLVNDIWGGDELSEWDKPFWELSLRKGLLMQERGVDTHIITAHYAASLLIRQGHGIIIEITDGEDLNYRGNLFYDLAKVSVIRLATAMAEELRPHGVTALAVTPGFLRSEAVLDHFGVSEANWQEGARQDPHFAASETPFYIGRAITALVADPHIAAKAGTVQSSWRLAREYGFKDVDDRQPDWGKHWQEYLAKGQQP